MSEELKPFDGCNGHGEVGGLRPDGYHTEPCPFCNGTGHDAPSPSVGADGLPELPQCFTRHWINAPFQDVELFTADQMRAYALADRASRPVGDGGADGARIDAIDRWLTKQRGEGFQWDTLSFTTNKPARDQLDQRFAARTAGTDTAGGW